MYLCYHGTGCCGMSAIYAFEYSPDSRLLAFTPDMVKQYQQAYPTFIVTNRPAETAKERFRALIMLREKTRSQGIIQVVLTESQLRWWGDVMKEFNFHEVGRNLNSNSGNTIVVLLRFSGREDTPKLTEPVAASTPKPKPVKANPIW